MNTKLTLFDGVHLIVPNEGFMFPHSTFKGFPTCCGGGDRGDLLIPDSIYLLNISPACWIHDQMWALAEPTWADFHHSNNVFLENMRLINEAKSNFLMKIVRTPRIHVYHQSVNTLGALLFWKLKCLQGKESIDKALADIQNNIETIGECNGNNSNH